MTKSRFLRVGAAIATAAMVGACSGPTVTPTPSPTIQVTPSAAPATPSKVYQYGDMVVGFIQTGAENSWTGSGSGWRSANTADFKSTATKLGVTLKFTDSGGKVDSEIAAFNQYVQDPTVNVIVLAAADTSGFDSALNAAKAAGKVVVLEDRKITADTSLYYTYVGPDFDKEGQNAAAAMCNLLKDASGKNVVVIGGDQSSTATTDRIKGFSTGNSCRMTVLDTQYAAGWDKAAAKTVMQTYLRKYAGKINGLFAVNDELAIAAIQTIDSTGIKAGKEIQVAGVDATADGFKYMISGELGADIECSPLLATQVYKAALDGLNGVQTTPKWIPSEEGQFFSAQGADALQKILDSRGY